MRAKLAVFVATVVPFGAAVTASAYQQQQRPGDLRAIERGYKVKVKGCVYEDSCRIDYRRGTWIIVRRPGR